MNPNFTKFRNETKFSTALEDTFEKLSYWRGQNQKFFFATHTPMKLYCDTNLESQQSIISEDEILDILVKRIGQKSDRLRKNIIIIKGDTGTGKSELCAYLTIKLKDLLREKLLILPIEKDQSWFEICSETLPRTFKEFFGKELPETESFYNFKKGIETEKGFLTEKSSKLGLSILEYLRKRKIISPLSDKDSPKKNFELSTPISEYLNTKLKIFFSTIHNGSKTKAREFNIFNPEIVKTLIRQSKISLITEIDMKDLTDEMNIGLTKAIKNEFNIRDINQVLRDFYIELERTTENTKILIVFEDFGLTGFDLDQFKKFLTTDKYENFDYIIAGTEPAVLGLIDLTMKARGNIFSTTRGNDLDTLFLTKENVSEFTGKYLKFFKSNLNCCATCNNDFNCLNELYPFSKFFLERLFINYEDKNRQPRSFLMMISGFLISLKSNVLPFNKAKEHVRYLSNYGVNTNIRDDTKLNLIKWYGKSYGDKEILIDENISKYFDISFDGNSNVILKSSDEIKDLSIFIGDMPTPHVEPPVGELEPIIDTEKQKLNSIFNEKIANFDRWFTNPTNLSSGVNEFNGLVKRGFKRVLNELGTEDIFSIFSLSKGDLLDHIYFKRNELKQDIIENSPLNKFKGIEITDFDKSFYKMIVKLGIIIFEILDLSDEEKKLTNELINDWFIELNGYKEIIIDILFKDISITIRNFLFTNDLDDKFKVYTGKSINAATSIEIMCFILIFFLYTHMYISNPLIDLRKTDNIRKFLFNNQEYVNETQFSFELPPDLEVISTINNDQAIIVDFFKSLLKDKKFLEAFNSLFIEINNPYEFINEMLNSLKQRRDTYLGILQNIKFKKNYGSKKTIVKYFTNFFKLTKSLKAYNRNRKFEEVLENFESNYFTFLNEIADLNKRKVLEAIANSSNLESSPFIKSEIRSFKEQLNTGFYQNIKDFVKSIKNISDMNLPRILMIDQLENNLNTNRLLITYKKLDSKLSSESMIIDLNPFKKLLEIL